MPYVTIEALLEAPVGGNAFATVHVHADRIVIDSCGTAVSDRVLPFPDLSVPPLTIA